MASDSERSRAYRDRKRGTPPRTPKPHGTMAAYRRHERNGEPACAECKKAHAEYQRGLYRKRKEQT